jgi:hypothetical protein
MSDRSPTASLIAQWELAFWSEAITLCISLTYILQTGWKLMEIIFGKKYFISVPKQAGPTC